MTAGQIALLILAWLTVSVIVAARVGHLVAYLRFGPPVSVGVDWPWWLAFRYGVIVFVGLQLALAAWLAL